MQVIKTQGLSLALSFSDNFPFCKRWSVANFSAAALKAKSRFHQAFSWAIYEVSAAILAMNFLLPKLNINLLKILQVYHFLLYIHRRYGFQKCQGDYGERQLCKRKQTAFKRRNFTKFCSMKLY